MEKYTHVCQGLPKRAWLKGAGRIKVIRPPGAPCGRIWSPMAPLVLWRVTARPSGRAAKQRGPWARFWGPWGPGGRKYPWPLLARPLLVAPKCVSQIIFTICFFSLQPTGLLVRTRVENTIKRLPGIMARRPCQSEWVQSP